MQRNTGLFGAQIGDGLFERAEDGTGDQAAGRMGVNTQLQYEVCNRPANQRRAEIACISQLRSFKAVKRRFANACESVFTGDADEKPVGLC